MSVYVDALFTMASSESQAYRVGARHGHRWCHLFADTEAEVIDFAVKKLGMRPNWIQRGSTVHFDLVPPRRAKAVLLGAKEIGRREVVELVRRLRGVAA